MSAPVEHVGTTECPCCHGRAKLRAPHLSTAEVENALIDCDRCGEGCGEQSRNLTLGKGRASC